MIYPKYLLAQSIIQTCLAKGITTIIILQGIECPTIGFTNNPAFECYSMRTSAVLFFWVLPNKLKVDCSSGSALNYYPAAKPSIVRFHNVISADRPQSKIDIGDGQTIRQENVFANHSLQCQFERDGLC
jgi:2-succinyl-5-enolpyruvyl-6-hydroxy-3-cyclohexene-1-carboxylate synthase